MSDNDESATPEPEDRPGLSLPDVQATTEGLLRAGLDAGLSAAEALNASRPRNWTN
jgi:hypothetical protein